jgi:hypothetical protein
LLRGWVESIFESFSDNHFYPRLDKFYLM